MLRLRRTKNWIFLGLTAALVLVQIKLIREVVKQSKIQLIWRTLFEEISHTEQWSSRGVQYAILYCVTPVCALHGNFFVLDSFNSVTSAWRRR